MRVSDRSLLNAPVEMVRSKRATVTHNDLSENFREQNVPVDRCRLTAGRVGAVEVGAVPLPGRHTGLEQRVVPPPGSMVVNFQRETGRK